MRTKRVWQCDASGNLLGATVAGESPLEPGVFLIPADAVETKPPYPLSGTQQWRWVRGSWVEVDVRR
ncbi:hypothetical protein BWP19_00920 [Stenotrophomonas maltophilia]|nr:hypothetical protein BU225_04945 [Stenotrophomonas sp. MB339]OMP40119.1 hypothetical protein BMR86_08930 [Stenotrophomonas sp. KAs 5-3]OOD20069.1 hypothetical protein BWP19_00920 [Stenotrophomonas maltophilia]